MIEFPLVLARGRASNAGPEANLSGPACEALHSETLHDAAKYECRAVQGAFTSFQAVDRAPMHISRQTAKQRHL